MYFAHIVNLDYFELEKKPITSQKRMLQFLRSVGFNCCAGELTIYLRIEF